MGVIQKYHPMPIAPPTARSAEPQQKKKNRRLLLPEEARVMGILLKAGRGSGKSRLEGRCIAWHDFITGTPTIFLDPMGAGIANFLDKVCRQPVDVQRALWPRVVYVDMAGSLDRVVPLPLYYRLNVGKRETLHEIAKRYIHFVRLLDPQLQNLPILGYNAFKFIAERVGMVLAALGYQITEAQDLLDNPEAWAERLHTVIRDYPEAEPAARFFLTEYLSWKPADKELRTNAFRAKLSDFLLDPRMHAMFGASVPGIDWGEVIRKRQIVLLDFRHETDDATRRLKMLWVFLYLRDYIRARGEGRHNQPVSLLLDELTALTSYDSAAQGLFADTLDELINVLSRNCRLWLTIGVQELFQVSERMTNSLKTLGTLILGASVDTKGSVELAKELFHYDPYAVKRYKPVYSSFRGISDVIDYEPIEFRADEQQLLHSYDIKEQRVFQFLVRPAAGEGDIQRNLYRISIKNMDKNQWVNEELVAEVRRRLSQRAGIPVQQVLAEIDSRLVSRPGRPFPSTPEESGPAAADAILSPPAYDNDIPPETTDDDEEQYLAEDV